MPIDVKQGQMLIRKIQYLLDGLELNAAEASNIEKDLMLGYISSLYELFLFDEPSAPEIKTKPATRAPEPIKITKEVKEVIPTPTPVPEPVVVEEPKITPAPPVEKPVVFAPPVLAVRANHEALFSFKKATDLSEKLRDRPISDLNKAFAINDKLLTISKLFDGDANAFKNVVKELNRLDSFEDAKVYLSHNVVDKFKWTTKTRAKTAKIFIMTVNRRFL